MFIRRLTTTIAVVVILVGGALAMRSGSQRSRLRAEYLQLLRDVGDLTIDDPAKVSLVAIDTGEPMHFAWRIYLPENYAFHLSHSSGTHSSSPNSQSAEFIARIRFRQTEDGRIEVFHKIYGGSGLSGIGLGDDAAALVRQHWDHLEVTQLGADGIVSFDPGEAHTLLKISLPEEVRAEVMETLSSRERSRTIPHFYYVTLGGRASP